MRPDQGSAVSPEVKRFRGRLIYAVVLGTLLALGSNCGVQAPRLSGGSAFPGGFRWAAGDTSRMLRNAQYFKLMGQPELGLKELEEAHRLDPGNLKLADALAQYYDELGMGTRAQQIYQEALALAPDSPALQNNLCFSYYQAGNWSQAETCYRKTLVRQPNNQVARNNLGLVLCRQGRQEEARQLWQEAEGAVVATQKLGEALAALGMAGETRYAQQPPHHLEGQSGLRHSLPRGPRGAEPATSTTGLRPSQASLAATHHEIETGTGPGAPPAGLAAAKPATTHPPKQIAPDSGSREVPAPKAIEPQVSGADPLPQQPGPGIVAENRPARPGSPQSEMTAAPPPRSSPREASTAPRPGRATPQPGLASQRGPQEAAGKTSLEKPRTNSRAPITVRELTETNIAILNGNGIHDLARATRSQLHLEGYNVVAINNFRDFGVDRTIIYYRPEAERVATILNKKFFPGAKFEPTPWLTDNIDVKIVLGHDLGFQQQAEAPKAHGPRL